ncbi:hypothetical protein KC19_1G097200 [Ceratodon purpureus]|uniref:Secreted protein n=2 Tax=Ceratodon purpureus TaxID=3225 RepID=A0A8T0J470_CERPU|nr:hypothetical protein KC19_1G097200 [Ceratodon purpureus]
MCMWIHGFFFCYQLFGWCRWLQGISHRSRWRVWRFDVVVELDFLPRDADNEAMTGPRSCPCSYLQHAMTWLGGWRGSEVETMLNTFRDTGVG